MTMFNISQEALFAKNCLKTHHIVVPDEWITACIEFLHEECNGEAIPQDTLNESVYEQWLNSDLHMLQTSCLPVNLVERMKIVLNGHFGLQIDEVVDVSQPAYLQFCKLRGALNENMFVSAEPPAKKEPKASRMLMLKLTDGTQTVQGMEYRTISQLDVNIKPGTKISVHGQIQCRKGVLLLTKDLVTLLGGEVDDLKETNTPLQVLARTLGQEEMLGQLDPTINNNTTTTTATPAVVNHEPTTALRGQNAPIEPPNRMLRLPTSSSTVRQPLSATGNANSVNRLEQTSVNNDVNNGFPDDDDMFPEATDFDWVADELDVDDPDFCQNGPRSESPVFPSSASASSHSAKPTNASAISSNSLWQSNTSSRGGTKRKTVTKKSTIITGQVAKRPSLTLSRNKTDANSKNNFKPKTLNHFFNPKPNAVQPASSVEPSRTSRNVGVSDFPSDDWDDFDVDLDESVFSNKSCSSGDKLESGKTVTKQVKTPASVKTITLESRLPKLNKKANTSSSDTSDANLPFVHSSQDVVIIEDDDDEADLITQHSPFTTIFEIKQLPLNLWTGTFIVRGFIAAVVSGLKPTDGGWNLPVKICDGTGHLEAVLTNQILEPLIGYKARSKQELKILARENPQYKENLKEAAIKCQVKLMNLCALLELKMSSNDKPRISRYVPVTDSILSVLQTPKRLSQSSGTSLDS